MWWLLLPPAFLGPSLGLPPAATPAVVVAEQSDGAGIPEFVDRLVAVVDEDPIFFSDLRRARGLGLVTSAGLPSASENWRPILDGLVDQRLRAHEVDRYGMPPAPAAAVVEQIARLAEELGGEERLAAELATLGSSRAELERLLGQQLRIYAYVEERLAPRVLIDDAAIAAYYDQELRPEMAKQGQPLPPLAEVQAGIRAVLRERALNAEITSWTEELRQRALIRDLLDQPGDPRHLPPILLQFGSQ